MGAVDNGTYREQRRIPFSKFCDRWLEEKKSRRKPTTYKFYRDIAKHLKAYFKDRPLHLIQPEDIEAYVRFKTKEGKLSPKTIGYRITVLRMIFKRAIILKHLKENPAQYVEKPRCEHKEMDYLKPDEVKLFLENVDKRYYPLFLTAIMTGLRQGELLALRWGDINWATNQIHVRRSVSLGKIDKPKSKHSIRAVSMPPMLISALKKHKLSCPVSEDELVFPNGAGKLMDARDLVNYQFLPALRRAGLRRLRFHNLRHTFSSLLIHSGENLKAI